MVRVFIKCNKWMDIGQFHILFLSCFFFKYSIGSNFIIFGCVIFSLFNWLRLNLLYRLHFDAMKKIKQREIIHTQDGYTQSYYTQT